MTQSIGSLVAKHSVNKTTIGRLIDLWELVGVLGASGPQHPGPCEPSDSVVWSILKHTYTRAHTHTNVGGMAGAEGWRGAGVSTVTSAHLSA